MYDSVEGVAEIEFGFLNYKLKTQNIGVLASVRIELKIIWLNWTAIFKMDNQQGPTV